MKIEEGKFYKDGYGNVCGPISRNPWAGRPWIDPSYCSYTDEGKLWDRVSLEDLVEEVENPDKTACKEVSMKPKSASEILEKLWSITTFGELVTGMCDCDDVSLEDLADRSKVGLDRTKAIVSNIVCPTVKEAGDIARALGYSEKPFIEKAIDRMLQDACEDFTCKLTRNAN
jgi:hypothetical protein